MVIMALNTLITHYLQYLVIELSLKIDNNFQNTIKQYNFCKTFNCPPYQSIQDTPAQLFEDFMKIEQEVNMYKASKGKENGDK